MVEDEVLAYRKVAGSDNPADINTKNVTQAAIDKALKQVELVTVEGRADSGLTVSMVMTTGMGGEDGGGTLGAAPIQPSITEEVDRSTADWPVCMGRWSDEAEEEEETQHGASVQLGKGH